MEFLRPGHIIIAANLCGPPPVPSNMYSSIMIKLRPEFKFPAKIKMGHYREM